MVRTSLNAPSFEGSGFFSSFFSSFFFSARPLSRASAHWPRNAQATSSPGTWRYIASRQCEWVGPSWWPAPWGILTTSGTFTWPPNM